MLLLGQGWWDQDDADALRYDAGLRLAASGSRGTTPLSAETHLASQPTLSRLIALLSTPANRNVLREAITELAGRRSWGLRGGHRQRYLTIDVDSLPIEVHGHQPGSAWNGHYHKRMYHPLVASVAETGDNLDARLRAIIAGEGQDRHSFESLAAGLGLGERIHFLGWVDPERVPEHLAAADVFIGPSRRDRDGSLEAQGLVFLEAMLAGTPVVATRLGGVVDFVSDGQTGLLVKENAPDEISEAVMRLVADPALRQRLSRVGHDLVMRGFTRDMTAKAFSELFATHRRRRKAGGAT